MDIITVVILAIVMLCVVVCWIVVRRGKQNATPQPGDIALRDSAAIALSCYWAHDNEGWSLALFRDDSGVIRHVACRIPDGTFFDAGGSCHEDQIAHRLGVSVTAENCDEEDVRPLLGRNNAVLEAAEELRHRIERKAP